MEKQEYSLPEINGLLSFPTEEVMKYGLDHYILDAPGLLMHIIFGRILVFQMAKALPEDVNFDIDTALSLTTVYHATRQAADYGRAGKHIDPKVNELMQTCHDIDYALQQAEIHGLDDSICQGIKHYRIDPATREQGDYFPHETLINDGKINWTETIPMLTSWLVAGVVMHIDKRFNDLRARRSGEIGKLELPYWKSKIDSNEGVILPKPIVDSALHDVLSGYKNQDEIIEGIRNGNVTNEIMGKWILDGYEDWANSVLEQYSKITGVSDFYTFLEKGIDSIGETQPDKKAKIKHSFEGMFGRDLAPDEFIPYIDGIELVFERIRGLKVASTRDIYRGKVERSMRNIERVIKKLSL